LILNLLAASDTFPSTATNISRMRASASTRQSPPATSAAAGREAGRAVASSASVAQLGQGERVLADLQQRHRRSHHVRELPHIPRPPQQGKGG
ncbi:hypothetical protein ABTL17_19195, partial [Acinetobacter baumannii]